MELFKSSIPVVQAAIDRLVEEARAAEAEGAHPEVGPVARDVVYVGSVSFGCVFDPAIVTAPPGWQFFYHSYTMVQEDPNDPNSIWVNGPPGLHDIWEMRTDPFQYGIAGQISRDFDLVTWPLSLGILQVPAVPEILAQLDLLYQCGAVLITDIEYTGDSPYEIEHRQTIAALQALPGP